MPVHAWESFVDRLLSMALDAAQSIIRIALIVAVAYVIMKLMRAAFYRLEAFVIHATEKTEMVPGAAAKRVKTLFGVLWTISCGFLWFIVVLTSFSQLGINIGPILAGAGVVGLAVGFGAQHLVRDLVSGFFLILENQIRVGDSAIINGTAGLVEAVTFRTIVLRDQTGVVYVFPNGAINTLANATLDWSGYVIDIAISYREDPDRVIDIMRRVADELKQDAVYGRVMLEPIEIFGVDAFTDSAVVIKARFKTLPATATFGGPRVSPPPQKSVRRRRRRSARFDPPRQCARRPANAPLVRRIHDANPRRKKRRAEPFPFAAKRVD